MKRIMLGLIMTPAFVYSQAISSTTAAIGNNVPVYEYVPKVIIEGKWGDKPGEFGVINDPMDAEALGVAQYPHSLAVNSKGEIYILDQINNRIQKFNKEGKYMNSIRVTGLADSKGDSIVEIRHFQSGCLYNIKSHPYIEGINIVIDSKDRMYYYLKRSSYSAEGGKISETGEVWEFVNDKVVKKMKQGEEKSDKKYNKFEVIQSTNATQIVLQFDDNKPFKFDPERIKKPFQIKDSGNKVQNPVITKDLVIFFTYGEGKGRASYVYDKKGNLKWFVKGIIPGDIDNDGNGYIMESNENGVVVTRYEKAAVE